MFNTDGDGDIPGQNSNLSNRIKSNYSDSMNSWLYSIFYFCFITFCGPLKGVIFCQVVMVTPLIQGRRMYIPPASQYHNAVMLYKIAWFNNLGGVGVNFFLEDKILRGGGNKSIREQKHLKKKRNWRKKLKFE